MTIPIHHGSCRSVGRGSATPELPPAISGRPVGVIQPSTGQYLQTLAAPAGAVGVIGGKE